MKKRFISIFLLCALLLSAISFTSCSNEAKPEEGYLTLKKLEALGKMADGNATKIVIPSELQGVVGLVNTIKEAK
jgi:hypothetical protein